ncbi:MAG: hypothetical protein M1827_001306 [Pycnora praestabilis]|nr:MAG: hypothetical protein M1827_001306 [Pycnora praestabilis]
MPFPMLDCASSGVWPSPASQVAKKVTPPRALFNDLSSAYTSITTRSNAMHREESLKSNSDEVEPIKCPLASLLTKMPLPPTPAAPGPDFHKYERIQAVIASQKPSSALPSSLQGRALEGPKRCIKALGALSRVQLDRSTRTDSLFKPARALSPQHIAEMDLSKPDPSGVKDRDILVSAPIRIDSCHLPHNAFSNTSLALNESFRNVFPVSKPYQRSSAIFAFQGELYAQQIDHQGYLKPFGSSGTNIQSIGNWRGCNEDRRNYELTNEVTVESTETSFARPFGDQQKYNAAFENLGLQSDRDTDEEGEQIDLKDGKQDATPQDKGLNEFRFFPTRQGDNDKIASAFQAMKYSPADADVAFVSDTLENRRPTFLVPVKGLTNSQRATNAPRNLSAVTSELSQLSSYGDTRELLNISSEQFISPKLSHEGSIFVAQGSPLASEETAYEACTEFSCKGIIEDQGYIDDCTRTILNRSVAEYKEPSSKEARTPTLSKKKIADMPFISTESKGESKSSQDLEKEISHGLQRVSRLSGVNNLSGSIFVMSQDSIYTSALGALDGSGSEQHVELGLGGSQSSSYYSKMSRIMSCKSSDQASSPLGRGSLYRYNRAPEPWREDTPTDFGLATGTGSASSTQRFTSDSTKDHNVLEEDDDRDEDHDWETVDGSRALNQCDVGNNLALEVTGSSLADYSSHDSLCIPVRRNIPLASMNEVLMHPVKEEYEHVYRLRITTSDAQPILIPAYSLGDGIGFPNCNALTCPASASLAMKTPYQHPTPLPKKHVHPFKYSPPTFHSETALGEMPAGLNTLPRTAADKCMAPSLRAEIKRGLSDDISLASLAENEKHDYCDMRFASKDGPLRCACSYPSSAWLSTSGEPIVEIGGTQELPDTRGSFSKCVNLGPLANVTGTPEGTGMRHVGSSLADGSSPGIKWSSSPGPLVTSSSDQNSSIIEENNPKYGANDCTYSFGRHSCGKPGLLYKQVRQHREHLAAEGLLPRSYTPPTISSNSRPLTLLSMHRNPNSDGRIASLLQPQGINALTNCRSLSFKAEPSLPIFAMRDNYMARACPDAHLHRLPRPESSIASQKWRRKTIISCAVLGLCLLFPPTLLLYGYGFMDGLIIHVSSGEIEHFGKKEKRAALCLGWGLAFSAVVAIVTGMAIIAE